MATTNRDDVIRTIKTALKTRSGKPWSVTGGRGTAWGWITISAPPARRSEFGGMSEADCAELAELLGTTVHRQGVLVGASSAFYREYVQRAQGEPPTEIAQPYWD